MLRELCDSPIIHRHLRLDRGAELLVQQQPWAERVGICLRVAAGSHDEPVRYPGLAHFLEHLLFLGSRNHRGEQRLMAYVQGLGGQVNASTQSRHTDFVCEVPAASLRPTLARLLEMLSQPLLAREAQLAEREVLEAEYRARSQDADSRISHALAQALPAAHRCAAFLTGNRASLAVEEEGFQQALRDYHQQHYRLSQMRLTLVGPQPVEQLLLIAEQSLLLAAEPAPVAIPAQACALLPVRASRLCLQHPAASVHLGYALQAPEAGLTMALGMLLDVLHDPAPKGLLDSLRRAGRCEQLRLRVLYRFRGQCLLRVDFPGADPAHGAWLRAMFQSWAAQMLGDDRWRHCLRRWRQTQRLQRQGLAPLAVARLLQDLFDDVDDGRVLRALAALLEQLGSGQGGVELCCTAAAQSVWPAVGLDLRLSAAPPCAVPALQRTWQLPEGDALLGPQSAGAALPLAAQLRWHPPVGHGGPAALYWRAGLAEWRCMNGARAALQARLADFRSRCERLGIVVQLEIHRQGWTLGLLGAPALLPACSAQLLPLLLAPLQQQSAAPPAEGLLLRRLLDLLPMLDETPSPPGLQGLGVGLGEQAQRAVEALFGRVEALPATPPVQGTGSAVNWQSVESAGEEAALLLFCPQPPQPPQRAQDEAAWRLLGHYLQGRFYDRLRGELQLGYALYGGYRQVQAQRGLLFALQSPHCDVAGIYRHICDFLTAQHQPIATLPPAQLERMRETLATSLAPAETSVGRAEQLWQSHLAGVGCDHLQAVRQALAGLDVSDLRLAHEQLLQGADNWRVLASAAPPSS